MRRGTIPAIVLAAAFALGACGGGSDGEVRGARAERSGEAVQPAAEGAPTELDEVDLEDEPEYEPQTAWDVLSLELARNGGETTKEIALQAFALTLGDVPGVDPPSVPNGEIGQHSATSALRWVTRHWDELTDDERAAVHAALGTEPDEADAAPAPDGEAGAEVESFEFELIGTHTAGRASARGTLDLFQGSCVKGTEYVTEDGPGAEQYRSMLDQEIRNVEGMLGRPLGIPVHLLLDQGHEGKETLAWMSPQTGRCATETANSCQVHLLTDRIAGKADADVRQVLAHEIVHCVEATWVPVLESMDKPDWLSEGFAEYVGMRLHPIGVPTNYLVYFAQTDEALFDRDYDAQGFYFQLEQAGGDVVGNIVEAYRAKENPAAFERLTAGAGTAFADSWASMMALEPERGPDWHTAGAPADALVAKKIGFLPNGKRLNITTAVAQTKLVEINFEAEVVQIAVGGGKHGRIGWDGFEETTLSELDGKRYCAVPGGCECPGGGGNPPSEQLPSARALVAIVGTTDATEMVVEGRALDDFCKEKPEPPAKPVEPCLVGRWQTTEWTMPGPMPAMNAVGGSGARVEISADGRVEWQFDEMQPLRAADPNLGIVTLHDSYGSAEGTATGHGGEWEVEVDGNGVRGRLIDEVMGEMPLGNAEGPAVMVMMRDGDYTCTRDGIVFTSDDPVEHLPVDVELVERD